MSEEMTNKKKEALPFIIAAAVVLIVLIAAISIYNTPANRIQRQLDLGQKYLDDENFEQAIVEFDKAIAIDPMCVDAYLGKAEAYEGMGDMDMALQTLEEGYAQTESERLREKIEEMNNVQSQQESESLEIQEAEAEAPDDIIEFSFELEDITIMGYDLFTDHYEDICAAYGCPVDTDPNDNDSVSVDNEYGHLSSDACLYDNGEYKALGFYQSTETTSYPALGYSSQANGTIFDISISSSFDRVADLESCGIHVPAPTGSYEEWSRMLQVQEIKEKGNPQTREDGTTRWNFQTKWGTAYYVEDGEYAELQIYLNGWNVGENSYNGMFCIERFPDFEGEVWNYWYHTW